MNEMLTLGTCISMCIDMTQRTRYEVAKTAGFNDTSQISKLCNERSTRPSWQIVCRVCDSLGMTTDELREMQRDGLVPRSLFVQYDPAFIVEYARAHGLRLRRPREF